MWLLNLKSASQILAVVEAAQILLHAVVIEFLSRVLQVAFLALYCVLAQCSHGIPYLKIECLVFYYKGHCSRVESIIFCLVKIL